jgi:hypothetical protein
MRKSIRQIILSLFFILLLGTAGKAEQRSSVQLIKSVDLPGYSGDFDHFAADYDHNRLLLAAEGHGTLEVFDLKTSDHLRTVAGFGKLQQLSARALPANHSLATKVQANQVKYRLAEINANRVYLHGNTSSVHLLYPG